MQSIHRLLAANSGSNVAVVGDFIWNKTSTGTLHIKTSEGETAALNDGEYVRFDKVFKEFYLKDESGSQNDTTLAIGKGDAGKYGGSVSIDNPQKLLDVTDVTVTASTATVVLASNSKRHKAIITSLASNSNITRIGSSSVSASRGTPISPGDTITLETQGAIYAYNTSAETFTVSYTEFN